VLALDSSVSFPALFLFLLFFFLLFVYLQLTFFTEGKTGKNVTPKTSKTNHPQHRKSLETLIQKSFFFPHIDLWMVFNGFSSILDHVFP